MNARPEALMDITARPDLVFTRGTSEIDAMIDGLRTAVRAFSPRRA